MTIIKQIESWFKAAVPNPTDDNRRVQLGCHLEEVDEMMQVVDRYMDYHGFDYCTDGYENIAHKSLKYERDLLKLGYVNGGTVKHIKIRDKTAFADALADQIVTAIGLAYMHGIDIEGALNEVNRSNWSKFVDGKPVFDENGKIKKGDDYTPPDLSDFVGDK